MKNLLNSFLVFLLVACSNGTKTSKTKENLHNTVTSESKKDDDKKIDLKLCEEFPKEIVVKYNTGAIKLEVIPKKHSTATNKYCDLKLFYGKKDYEFWKGQIGAYVSKQENPFWQYNPERNASLYHKVSLGEKAVFITNMNQLLILKDGIVYDIVPPNNGATTNSGKSNKEIAIEIAKYYKL